MVSTARREESVMAHKLPHDAFQRYFSLGPTRSYQAVADAFGVSKKSVTNRATAERWQDRLAILEEQARQNTEQKALETLDAMNDRHLKSLRVIQGKSLETLKNLPLNSAMDAVRALDLSIRQERTIRGEPGDRTAVSVEEIVRREYSRWLNVESENGNGDGNTQEIEQGCVLP